MRLAAALILFAPMAGAQEMADAPAAVLRGLDKVSGITQDLEVAVGSAMVFGRLTVAVSACRFPANDPSANAFAHLTISDKNQEAPAFDGWMVAASPALNALDHPRYDVWVLRCKTAAADGPSD